MSFIKIKDRQFPFSLTMGALLEVEKEFKIPIGEVFQRIEKGSIQDILKFLSIIVSYNGGNREEVEQLIKSLSLQEFNKVVEQIGAILKEHTEVGKPEG